MQTLKFITRCVFACNRNRNFFENIPMSDGRNKIVVCRIRSKFMGKYYGGRQYYCTTQLTKQHERKWTNKYLKRECMQNEFNRHRIHYRHCSTNLLFPRYFIQTEQQTDWHCCIDLYSSIVFTGGTHILICPIILLCRTQFFFSGAHKVTVTIDKRNFSVKKQINSRANPIANRHRYGVRCLLSTSDNVWLPCIRININYVPPNCHIIQSVYSVLKN